MESPTLLNIRTELLNQHASLRKLIADAKQAAVPLRGGPFDRAEIQTRLAELADAVCSHIEREEELLRGVIPHVDAWGSARAQIMDEEHVSEHAALASALQRASIVPGPDEPATAILSTLNELLSHMEREEKVFLNEKVLSDEFPPGDSFGG